MVHLNPRPMPSFEAGEREVIINRILDGSEIDPVTGCWVWQRGRCPRGYGRTSLRRVVWPAHRLSVIVFDGPFDPRLDVDHLCRNPPCVNPDHLEPVTTRTNLLRGETIPAGHLAKTHCPQGHPYAGDNLLIRASGRRACRECNRDYGRRRTLRRNAA
jgi:hypothetical protein